MYVRDANSQRLMYFHGEILSMPCDSCGHSRASHREMTLSVYFCSQCQSVESGITFPPDRPAQDDVAKLSASDDMLSQLYYNHKAFRRA